MDVEQTPLPQQEKKKRSSAKSKRVIVDESESDSNSQSEEVVQKTKKVSKRSSSSKKDKKKDSSKKKSGSSKKKPAATVAPEVNKKKRKAAEAVDDDSEEEKIPKKSGKGKGGKGKGKGGVAAEPNALEKVTEELTKLYVPFDSSKLGKLRRHDIKCYEELVEIMSEQKLKGLIYAYSVKTPVGRIFSYEPKERKFKSLHREHNLITLAKYTEEGLLSLTEIQKTLSDAQRKSLLEAVGITGSDLVTPENWLYAFIEGGIIVHNTTKPLTTQSTGAILFHDVNKKQTFWLTSTKGKERFARAIVTRTRTIHDSNMENELTNLLAKRKEIIRFLEKNECLATATTTTTVSLSVENGNDTMIITTTPIPPQPSKKKASRALAPDTTIFDDHGERKKPTAPVPTPSKKKKAAATTTPTPSKKKPEPKPRAKKQKIEHVAEKEEEMPVRTQSKISQLMREKLNALAFSSEDDSDESLEEKKKKNDEEEEGEGSSGSSSSQSTSESSEDSEESIDRKKEAQLKAAVMKKQQKAGYKPNTDPNATSITKSLEVKRNLDEALKHKKVMDDLLEPEIRYFRTNCC